MAQSNFSKLRKAVVMGYSIRLVYGAYDAMKKGQFKGSMTSFSTFYRKIKPIFVSMEHYKFALIFCNVTSTINILQRIYDRYIIQKEKRMDTKITKHYAKQKQRNKIRSNVLFSILSCVWFKRLPKQFRHWVVLHLFVRASYDMIKLYKCDKMIPDFKYDEIIFVSFIFAMIGFFMCHYPSVISPGYYKFLTKWGHNTPQQLRIMFQTPDAFTPCSPTWHKHPSCAKHYATLFVSDVFKSSRIYSIIHVLPLLFQLRFYKLLYKLIISFMTNVNMDGNNKNDAKSSRMELLRLIIKKFVAIFRSCVFFSGFQSLGKLLMCWMRYYVFQSDPKLNTILCIMVGTSVAQLCETSARRVQYGLYLTPQVCKMVTNALHNRFGLIRFGMFYEWWDIILIQIAFAFWSYLVSINKTDICDKLTSSLVIRTFF